MGTVKVTQIPVDNWYLKFIDPEGMKEVDFGRSPSMKSTRPEIWVGEREKERARCFQWPKKRDERKVGWGWSVRPPWGFEPLISATERGNITDMKSYKQKKKKEKKREQRWWW